MVVLKYKIKTVSIAAKLLEQLMYVTLSILCQYSTILL